MRKKKNNIVRICQICKQPFIPDKYHPYQKVCSKKECQHKRQLLNQKMWRQKNPDYFRYKERKDAWQKERAEYLKKWREKRKKQKLALLS